MVRVTLIEAERMTYRVAEPDVKYRLAASAESKTDVVVELVQASRPANSVIGQYVDQLEELAVSWTRRSPAIRPYGSARSCRSLAGEVELLVVSKVANFSVDLPTAQVAIQVSGAFWLPTGEAQRLGRLLRPKSEGTTARFYAVVARDTVDTDFAAHRQRFLAEQGYAYRILDAEDALSAE